ncbi:hypothetical protein LTR53_001475 [Teratosphaeriaceae sp. CCFEE 6253]|nr:hypothetical protein LTR53_001475 [Teratosphaeriaceae sp. CCFEE 6253]
MSSGPSAPWPSSLGSSRQVERATDIHSISPGLHDSQAQVRQQDRAYFQCRHLSIDQQQHICRSTDRLRRLRQPLLHKLLILRPHGPPPPSTDLATAWQLKDKKKIVHTCEPDHGELLTKFKSGTFDYNQRTATNVPTKKVDVPRPGGRVERMWRCAKPSCEYCTWTTQSTDLSEKVAKGHLLFGVPSKKRIRGADGKPTYTQQGPAVPSRGGVQPVPPFPANYGTASPFTAAPSQVFDFAQAPASGYQA